MSLSSRVFRASVPLALSVASPALAGDVEVVQKGATLKVSGDDLDATLQLYGYTAEYVVTPAYVRVTPLQATTVNGLAEEVEYFGVSRLKVQLGDGLNSLLFGSLDLAGGLELKGGAGIDFVTVELGTFGGNVSLASREEFLGFTCQETQIAGKLEVKAGSDEDRVSLDGCEIGGNVRLALGDGPNRVLPTSSFFSKSVSIKAGSGADIVLLSAGDVGAKLDLALGDGANAVVMNDLAVGGKISYKGGRGDDSVVGSPIRVGLGASGKFGGGANTLVLEASSQIGESLSVSAGDGMDVVAIFATQIGEDAKLKLGSGNNTLALGDAQIGDDLSVAAGAGDDQIIFTGVVSVGDKMKLSLDGGTNTGP